MSIVSILCSKLLESFAHIRRSTRWILKVEQISNTVRCLKEASAVELLKDTKGRQRQTTKRATPTHKNNTRSQHTAAWVSGVQKQMRKVTRWKFASFLLTRQRQRILWLSPVPSILRHRYPSIHSHSADWTASAKRDACKCCQRCHYLFVPKQKLFIEPYL